MRALPAVRAGMVLLTFGFPGQGCGAPLMMPDGSGVSGADSRGVVEPVEPAAPSVGRVDNAGLNRFMNSQNPDLQACYNRELAANPTLSGRVEIEFTIDASGAVSGAHLRGNELNESIADCILGEVRGWHPGFVEGGSVTVRRTYLFEPWDSSEGSSD